jgi:hypothetical protein
MTNSNVPARLRAILLASLATAIATLAFSAAAQAAANPIAGGNTDLHLKNGMQRKLSNLGVDVLGLGATSVSGKKIGLVVSEGKLDPTDGQGELENRGGFKLALGRRGVPVTNVEVDTVRGLVIARVAGARMQFGTFASPSTAREGFGARLKAGQLVLSEKVATRISNRLGLKGSRRIAGGRVLSNLFVAAQPRTVTLLPQGSASLVANAATVAKFKAKGVEVPAGFSAVAPATEPNSLVFQLPITGGEMQLSSSTGAGQVETAGGIQILKSTKTLSPQVVIKALSIDLTAKQASAEFEITPAPPFAGNTARSFGVSLTVPNGALVADPTTRQIEVKGVEAKLEANAVGTLNNVFDQPAPAPPAPSNFVVGDPLGTFTLVAQAQ